jgi:predicted DsbA family dithiol-disulfide isomerase
VWLDRVKKAYVDRLEITWRNFSLEQINSKEGPEWKAWEQPDLNERRSLIAAMAAEAARRQGQELYEKFHLTLLTARHGGEGRIALNEEEPLIDLAKQVGLDIERFREDLKDRDLANIIGQDHTEAAGNHGIFGTPTFLFENGHSVYLKTFIPPDEDSENAFEHFIAIASQRTYVGELKRPQPPWPKGALG